MSLQITHGDRYPSGKQTALNSQSQDLRTPLQVVLRDDIFLQRTFPDKRSLESLKQGHPVQPLKP